ncbi:MAG: SDR family oxidoreductase [Bowdeniella nasicola]|nr:SDR family oxidoreductase [Bowdeniella nasicola]
MAHPRPHPQQRPAVSAGGLALPARAGTALITGASSGLGREFAWQLAAKRCDLILVARREAHLVDLAGQISAVAGVRCEVIVADLATDAGRTRVAARCADRHRPLNVVVNNAGFGLGQPFLGGDLKREQAAIDVMVRAVMELSHAAAPVMAARGRGAIINVASMVARTAMGTYAAAKAWVRSFSEALACELAGTGVQVTAVSPGLVRTEFHAAAKLPAEVWPRLGWLSAETVVSQTLSGVARGKVHVIPTWRYRVVEAALAASPRALVRTVAGPKAWRGLTCGQGPVQ